MKQWHFKMEKFCSKNLELWLMNWADQCISEKLLRKKLFVLYYTNIEKVGMFHVLHDGVALLMRSRWIVTKEFLERFGPYV